MYMVVVNAKIVKQKSAFCGLAKALLWPRFFVSQYLCGDRICVENRCIFLYILFKIFQNTLFLAKHFSEALGI